MAFNPNKNRQITQSDLQDDSFHNMEQAQDSHDFQIEDELLNYNSIPVADETIEKPLSFEGVKVADLQEVGLETISLLKIASKTAIAKQKFNIPLLKSLSLHQVLMHFGATTEETNVYNIFGTEITLQAQTNKWYNRTLARGTVDAINLTKHLIAIQENIHDLDKSLAFEIDNSKRLFIAAGTLLTNIHNTLSQKSKVEAAVDYVDSNEKSDATLPTQTDNTAVSPENVSANGQPPKTYEEKQLEWAKQKERSKAITNEINEIPLEIILESFGAIKKNPEKWKFPDTGQNIGVKGQTWKNFNGDSKGYGGINLIADYLAERDNIRTSNKEERTALWFKARELILAEFGQDIEDDVYKGYITNKVLKEPFHMPHVIDFKINEVRSYLNEKRDLPMWIINKHIKETTLFAGAPSWKTIPFLRDPTKLTNENVYAVFLAPSGDSAEMRGIGRSDELAKIVAKGSVTEGGGFLVKPEKDCNERVIAAVEAAIDTCSYHALYPGRGAASCVGVNYNLALKSALDVHDSENWKFEFAFDNDFAGNTAAVRFKEAFIEEVGEEEYNNFYNSGRLSYFPLGIKCLQECIAQNKTFYFDVSNNDLGKEAAIIFQKQLLKIMPMTEIREIIKNGLLKYANVCPVWEKTVDPEAEAQNVFNLLNTQTPFYLRIKDIKEENEDIDSIDKLEELQMLLDRKSKFEEALQRISGDKYELWKSQGKIIDKKMDIAKDWNEYLQYVKNKPEIAAQLEATEQKYGPVYAPELPKKMKLKRSI